MPNLKCTNPSCGREKLSLGNARKACGKCGSAMVPKDRLAPATSNAKRRPREQVTVAVVREQYPEQVAQLEAVAFERGQKASGGGDDRYDKGFAEAVSMVGELAELQAKCLKKDGSPRADAVSEDLDRMRELEAVLAAADPELDGIE